MTINRNTGRPIEYLTHTDWACLPIRAIVDICGDKCYLYPTRRPGPNGRGIEVVWKWSRVPLTERLRAYAVHLGAPKP